MKGIRNGSYWDIRVLKNVRQWLSADAKILKCLIESITDYIVSVEKLTGSSGAQ